MKFYTACAIKGNKILVRGYRNGVRFTDSVSFKPSLFIQSTKTDKTKYRTLTNVPVKQMRFDTLYDCRQFLDQYRDLPDNPIYGNTDFITQYLIETYPADVEYDLSKIRIAYLDLECETENGFPDLDSPNERINLVTIRIDKVDYVLTSKQVSLPDCKVILCSNEKEIIKKIFDILKTKDVDILTGWNIKLFDIPYIMGRAKLFFDEAEIQEWMPFNLLKMRETDIGGKIFKLYEFPGYTILDYIDLYKKFSGTSQESYALNHIAKVELDAQKLDYSEYGSIREFYTKDFQRFAEYNVQDVALVEQLDNKLKLIDLAVSIAYEAKITYDTVFFATRIWETICCDYLLKKGIIPPLKRKYDKDDQFVGAYVKEVTPGLYKNVVSFDATSLYPSIIMGWNISPETCTKKDSSYSADDFLRSHRKEIPTLKKDALDTDSCLACNGSFFTRKIKGFIPTLIEITFNQRKEAKNKMLELEKEYENTNNSNLLPRIAALKIRQSVKKILANSLYGCLGNPAFTYSSPELATAVTVTGQVIIRTAESAMNEYINRVVKKETPKDYVIAVDTDSVYLNLNDVICKVEEKTPINDITSFVNEICEKNIQRELNKTMEALTNDLNCQTNKIFFKREAIASAAMFVAKKRYALLVWDLEGVRFHEPKLKIMGLETARSSTPSIVRNKLKECIKIILTKTPEDLRSYVDEFYDKFMHLPMEDIASPRGVKGLKKYHSSTDIYQSGTPIATKAALLYNAYCKKIGVEKEVQPIKENDKMKFVFLKVPNPYGQAGKDAVIGFINKPPIQFNLEKYIDRKKQFDKTFGEPLDNILNAINWQLNQKNSLEEFFV
jgi:DNA polymerase elongation subunit (family B)